MEADAPGQDKKADELEADAPTTLRVGPTLLALRVRTENLGQVGTVITVRR